MFDIGLSTCGKEYGDALFASYKASGIKKLEISLPKYGCDSFDYMSAKKYSEKYGVELWSFHLPFVPFADIDISSPEKCDKTVKYLENIICKASEAGFHHFIIHPSAEIHQDVEKLTAEGRALRLETAKNSLYKLAQIGKREGGTICVEDLPRACLGNTSAEILYLLEADESLRVCFDTNHLLTEDPIHFIEAVGEKIVTLHVSDYDFINERHWLPGEGKIDWQALLNALKKAGYKGPWLYEVSYKAPDSITRCRDLTCEDFARNAEAVFAGKLNEFKII